MFDRTRKNSAGRLSGTCRPRRPQACEAADLIASQVNFGFTYTREAQKAYHEGELTYGDVAKTIAMNSYAAALRFAGGLHDDLPANLLGQIEALEVELVELEQSAKSDFLSIA